MTPTVFATNVLALVSCATAAVVQDQGNVIQKVIVMLENNKAKIQKDLQSEEKEMTAYAEYCDDETTKKQYALKDSDRKIASVTAAMEDAESQIASLDTDISDLGS